MNTQSYTVNTAALRKEAETKLCENPKTRKKALRELRDWVESQKHISGCRTDNSFLLHCKCLQGFTGKVHSMLVKIIGKHYTEANYNNITGKIFKGYG